MKTTALLLFSLLIKGFCFNQTPNEITISFSEIVRSQHDCILTIKISRNDSTKFVFPTKYTIGEMSDNVDLVYNVEKFDNGRYETYRCSKSPLAMPGFPLNDIELKEYSSITIVDSLDRLVCFERGQYRIQILYNNRGTSGTELPNIQAKSNWVEFKVEADKVLLGYSGQIRRVKN